MKENKELPDIVPLLPLRNRVIFPKMALPLYVGRERSILAMEKAFHGDGHILFVAQKDPEILEPDINDIYKTGVLSHVIQLFRLRDGTFKTLVNGIIKVKITNIIQEYPFYKVEYTPEAFISKEVEPEVVKTLVSQIKEKFISFIKANDKLPMEMITAVSQINKAQNLCNVIMGQFSPNISQERSQKILELNKLDLLLKNIDSLLDEELKLLKNGRNLRKKIEKINFSDQKKEIKFSDSQQEQAEVNELKKEYEEIRDRIYEKELDDEVQKKVLDELRKLKLMSPMSAEASIIRNYIDWILALPWNKIRDNEINIHKAAKILDKDHYGMRKPKERILEHLAVQSLSGKVTGPILCFTGPPGVGKTSLARSVARACGREYVRLSLGGVKDESEIRGHRRTYIGAMPGKIIQSFRKVESSNPVFLLDEIDKLSSDFRGDPSSALLEVLDPEQNDTFTDHYLSVEYNLSQVMFIATSNSLADIPWALRDRMEIIELEGYTEWEKLEIAKRHLLPKQIDKNGLKPQNINFSENAIHKLINNYTREAGVRDLERNISSVCRKIAYDMVISTSKSTNKTFHIRKNSVNTWLGKEKYNLNRRKEQSYTGFVNGLAVTSFGGDLITAEVTTVPGKGKLLLTGKLGEVMQESAQAALSWTRSKAMDYGLKKDFFEEIDIHIHFPKGAIPKDGPSAGITIATAIVSALLNIPVRFDVAMTGEITLSGRVLQIGGLKQKLLAAHRSGIGQVIIPGENKSDLNEVPSRVLKELEVNTVDNIEQVLSLALDSDKFPPA
ncbi:MAG: endopeptidase La [Myxococcota bacterium]